MQNTITFLLICQLAFHTTGQSQENSSQSYRNFPITVSLQFNSLSMPFRDIGGLFRNVGIGIGTEISFNSRHDWAQQFSALWYHNKAMGNGWVMYTQTAYRPGIGKAGWYAEIKGGAGYYVMKRPNPGWQQQHNEWVPAPPKGKGMLTVPIGVGIGYHVWQAKTYMAPSLSYQFMPCFGYNPGIPAIPQTFLQANLAVHPSY